MVVWEGVSRVTGCPIPIIPPQGCSILGLLFLIFSLLGPVALPGTEQLWAKVGFGRPIIVGVLLSVPAYFFRGVDSRRDEPTLLQLFLMVAMALVGGGFCFWLSFAANLNRAEFSLLLSFVVGFPATVITWQRQ